MTEISETPFHELHPATRTRLVNEFRVWRAGQAVNWECTAVDLAHELDLHVGTVSLIVKNRGWACLGADDVRHANVPERIDIYSAMQSQSPQYLGRV